MKGDYMPPEIKESQFLKDFYEMKIGIEVIKKHLDDCSRTNGVCQTHHDYITSKNAIDGSINGLMVKTSMLTGAVVGVITLLLKMFHVV